MRQLDVKEFYNHPYVVHNEFGDLVIFNYTHGCQFDRAWDDITLQARGLILDKNTGEIVSLVWKKFFNLGEMPDLTIPNLPKGPFTATVKMDGSMGIHYVYKNQHHIATRGSFVSEQAQWATKWFRENVDTTDMDSEYTYLFEIIYRENKIVVDYGDFEGLVLLSCIHKDTGQELTYRSLVLEADKLGVRVVEQETGFNNLEDLYTYCKGLPHTQEGFVVTFSNGLKVKIKGDEYCKIHKIIAWMTPLAFWEAWDLDTHEIPKSYLEQVPEEFEETREALAEYINGAHMSMYQEAQEAYKALIDILGPDPDKKSMALKAKELYPKMMSFVMDLYNGSEWKIWWKIHRHVRPTGNVIPDGVRGAERVKRIQDEG